MIEYYEKIYNEKYYEKLDNLEEMDKFLETLMSQNLIRKKENLNRLTSDEIESVIRKTPNRNKFGTEGLHR